MDRVGLTIVHSYGLFESQKKSIGHPVCHFMKIEFECGNEEKMGDIFNFNFKLIPFGSAKFAKVKFRADRQISLLNHQPWPCRAKGHAFCEQAYFLSITFFQFILDFSKSRAEGAVGFYFFMRSRFLGCRLSEAFLLLPGSTRWTAFYLG